MEAFSGPEAAALFEQYLHTICAESDRGAVLVAAALLDAGLEAALKKKLVPSEKEDDPLFTSGYAPLRSFAAKTELAYRLGLITRETCQMLHLFRKVRNDFAHKADEMTLNDAPIRQRLRAMFDVQPELHRAVFGTFEEIIKKEGGTAVPPDFMESVRGRREVFNVFFAVNAMALRRIELQIDQTQELR